MEVIYKELEMAHRISVSPKEWGYEIWHVNTPGYCCKTLVLYPGYSCSRHYHRVKDETFIVIDGEIELYLDGHERVLKRGMAVRILPHQVHSFSCRGRISAMLEVSTNHREDDSYRIDVSHRYDLGGKPLGEYLGLVAKFRDVKVIVLGDYMLDWYWEGIVTRVSPEAQCVIVENPSERWACGGAGNAAANVTAPGGKVLAIGVIGKDERGQKLFELLETIAVNTRGMFVDDSRGTTTKLRVMSSAGHITRVDWETTQPVAENIENIILNKLQDNIADANALILSNYDKGVLTEGVITSAVKMAKEAGIPVIADPKHSHFWAFDGVTVLKPNIHRLEAELDRQIVTETQMLEAAQEVIAKLHPETLLLTRGKAGMSLYNADGLVEHIAAKVVPVSELSGAGDTVVAIMALCMGAGEDVLTAAHTANVAASLVVAKPGTATVTPTELADALS